MRNLGLTSMGKDNLRDLKLIAEIIREEGFDVVALQEVLSEGKAFISPNYAKKCILMELGGEREWGFEWADASSKTADNRGEGYAFLWNKRRLRLTTTKLENGSIREFKPQMLNNVKSRVMQRYPYYARFTPQGALGGTNFEIRLICIHTHYGKNDSHANRAIRQIELDTIMKEIYPQISDKIYKNDMPHYTIILGDYNAELWRPWREQNRKRENAELRANGKSPPKMPMCIPDEVVVESSKWGKRIIIKTVQDKLTTLKSSNDSQQDSGYCAAESHPTELGDISECNIDFENMNFQSKIAAEYSSAECRDMFLEETSDSNNCYSRNYDHFSFEEAQFEDVKWKVKRVNAVREYCGNDPEKYIKTVSDHVPIMMEINLK